MPAFRSLLLAAVFVPLTGASLLAQQAGPPPTPMGLTSSSFTDGGIIPDKYTQASTAPISPALAWTGVPAVTQSFALVLADPDTTLQLTPNEGLHSPAF